MMWPKICAFCEVSYSEIKQFVWTKYPDVNSSTLTCQIIVCSVNHPSRIHYPENKKPRACTTQYDFLYNTSRGRVTLYDPERHGLWEIAETTDSRLVVRLAQEGVDESGTQQTDVGPIDLLTVTPAGDFYVFELKLGRGPDAALGQICRYMGWVAKHLADGRKVYGVILAADISEKLRYAVTQVPQVSLLEYELEFVIKPIQSR